MGNPKKGTAVEEKTLLFSSDQKEKGLFVGRLLFFLPSGTIFGESSSIVFTQPLFIRGSGFVYSFIWIYFIIILLKTSFPVRRSTNKIGHFDEQSGLSITFLLNFCQTNPLLSPFKILVRTSVGDKVKGK